MQLNSLRADRGFNIVEIVVALALLAFGLYGAADLIASARHTSTLTHRRLQASSLAQLKLQELRCARKGLLPLFANGAQTIDLPTSGSETFEQNGSYAWKAKLALNNSEPRQIEITVNVDLVSGSGATGLAQVRGNAVLASATKGPGGTP